MKKLAIVAFAALALVAAALLPRLFGPAAPAVAADKPAAPAAAPGVPVTAGTVATADVPVLLQAIGSVQAYNMVTIKSRVDGQIVAVDFTEGQDVKAGTPLIQIDPRPYQAALEQAEAAKQKDEAQLASVQQDLDALDRARRRRATSRGRPTTRPRRRSTSSRPRSRATRRRSTRRGSISAMPRSARRSTAGSAPGLSISAIMVRATEGTSLVTMSAAQADLRDLHAAAGALRTSCARSRRRRRSRSWPLAKTTRRRSPTAN